LNSEKIGNQAQSLATDRDLSRKLETEVIANNPRLANSSSTLVAMIRGGYIDATTCACGAYLHPKLICRYGES
jgi:hypothetical protein